MPTTAARPCSLYAVFKGEEAVIRALLAGGADPKAGTPSAVDTARMFAKADLLELFGAE